MIAHVGVDHTVGIVAREAAIVELRGRLSEAYVFLQTCNRVELYWGDGAAQRRVVRHLFRVVSGLESKMLGETHIQGQVKCAYATAGQEGHLSSGLHRLFQAALRCGKRVRSETALSRGAISHAHAAVLAVQGWSDCPSRESILLVGVGGLTRRVARILQQKFDVDLTVANRTPSNVRSECYGHVTVLSLEEAAAVGGRFSVVISATSAPHTLIHPDWFLSCRRRLLVDLAVPRDIDPRTAALRGTTLWTLEDIESQVRAALGVRHREVHRAGWIVEEEVDTYMGELSRRVAC